MKRSRGFTLIELMIVTAIIGILVAVLGNVGNCSGRDLEAEAAQTVKNFGFTNVELGERAPFRACGRDYSFRRNFTAVNPKGDNVHGAVCCGYRTGCTIKF